MELVEAQRIIGEKVENPAASIPDETLIDALATVIVRNGLLAVAPDPSGLVRLASSPGLEATSGFDATAPPPGFGDRRAVPGLEARSYDISDARRDAAVEMLKRHVRKQRPDSAYDADLEHLDEAILAFADEWATQTGNEVTR